MFENHLKPKNIFKAVLAVCVGWLIAEVMPDTYATYLEPMKQNYVNSWEYMEADPWTWEYAEVVFTEEESREFLDAPGTPGILPPGDWFPPAPILSGSCPFDPHNPTDPGHPDNPANNLTWWGPDGESGMLWPIECHPTSAKPNCQFDPYNLTDPLHPDNPNNSYNWWGRGPIPWSRACPPPRTPQRPGMICPFNPHDPTDPGHPDNPANNLTWWGPNGEGGIRWPTECKPTLQHPGWELGTTPVAPGRPDSEALGTLPGNPLPPPGWEAPLPGTPSTPERPSAVPPLGVPEPEIPIPSESASPSVTTVVPIDSGEPMLPEQEDLPANARGGWWNNSHWRNRLASRWSNRAVRYHSRDRLNWNWHNPNNENVTQQQTHNAFGN